MLTFVNNNKLAQQFKNNGINQKVKTNITFICLATTVEGMYMSINLSFRLQFAHFCPKTQLNGLYAVEIPFSRKLLQLEIPHSFINTFKNRNLSLVFRKIAHT